MPSVESSTRMEYSKIRREESARYSIERTKVAVEPISARIFRKRAKSSTMKLPPNVVTFPEGNNNSSTPVTTNRQTERPVTRRVVWPTRKAPIINSTMAPTASTSSGSTGRS